jgi:hypothetical protein
VRHEYGLDKSFLDRVFSGGSGAPAPTTVAPPQITLTVPATTAPSYSAESNPNSSDAIVRMVVRTGNLQLVVGDVSIALENSQNNHLRGYGLTKSGRRRKNDR